MEHALGLRGVRVISADHGAPLGQVCTVYVDPCGHRIGALSYRSGRVGGRELLVATQDASWCSPELVAVVDEHVAHAITHDALPGPSLAQLIGREVHSTSGQVLGTLADILISPDWSINGLLLSDQRRISCRADQIQIADPVIVPDDCVDDVTLRPELLPQLVRSFFAAAVTSHKHDERPSPYGRQSPKSGTLAEDR